MSDVLNIRPLKIEDAFYVHKIWTDPSVVKMTLRDPHMSFDDVKSRLRTTLETYSTDTIVGELENGEVIGIGGINYYGGKLSHVADLNLMIRGDYQGKGYGSLMFKKLLEIADNKGIKVIEIKCHMDNEAGLKLYKKNGFEIEGILRKRVNRDGELKDIYIMSRLKP